MSAATRATTAKQRATIAIRMMKSNTSGSFSRAFDDCFEMGDGYEVVVEIARRAMRNPALLELVKQNRGVSWSSVEAAINTLRGINMKIENSACTKCGDWREGDGKTFFEYPYGPYPEICTGNPKESD